MAARPQILASAQAQFPKSANKQVVVKGAWRPEDSTTGKNHPEPNGPDGWTNVGRFATRETLEALRGKGFTWVSLETGGTSWPFRDVAVSELI